MEEPKKENAFMNYLKHPAMWFNALIGRSAPIAIPEHQVTYQEQKANPQPTAVAASPQPQPMQPTQAPSVEDPIAKDLAVAGGFFKKLSAKVSQVTTPAINKGKEVSEEAVSTGGEFVKTDKFKKILPMILFALVLLLILGVGFYFVRGFMNRTVDPTIVEGPTPTLVEYIPSEPSLYVTDEEVLKLEQQISVLDREIAGVQLRETTLTPPTLDFNINFQ